MAHGGFLVYVDAGELGSRETSEGAIIQGRGLVAQCTMIRADVRAKVMF